MTAAVDSFDTARDRHLFGPGPKRLLALDGGGVRGAITVAFLERIEELLSQGQQKRVRLADHFDFIGGTSTGAVIAGALALGYRTDQVKDFYIRLAPHAFKREFWRIPILQTRFDARGLRREIEAIVGDRTLASPDLVTGLGIVTKRIDTGSPWIVTNNPRAPYWEDGPDYIGNKHYKLATLVRASTAAPNFFEPELLPIAEQKPMLPNLIAVPFDQPDAVRFLHAMLERCGLRRRTIIDPAQFGLFVDGGVSPHNNPSLAFLHVVALKPFRICWPMGPEELTIVSVGTGTHRPRLRYDSLGFARTLKLAFHALMSLMHDSEVAVLTQMQWLGECLAPWTISSEIGTLADDAPPGGKLFRFLRYDVRLEQDWLKSELGIDVSALDVTRFRLMDDPKIVTDIFEIGRIAADRYVKFEHWRTC
jgi:uncharacterized protein